MSDEIRSNTQEFLSFLGTCMYFYEHNLTPYEQNHIMYETGMLLRDYLSPNNRNKLIAVLLKGIHENPALYADIDSIRDMYPESMFNTTDVNAVREAYHTGQTHAVMRDYKDFRDDPEMGGDTDGKDGI